MSISSVNPATGQVLKKFEPHSDAEVERRVALAQRTFPTWRRTSWRERSEKAFRRRSDPRQSQGRVGPADDRSRWASPSASAVAEAEKCAWACRYYAENAERFLADEPAPTDASRSYVRYDPLGAGARRHALELPVLAGVPLRRAGADGGQRRAAQARLERSRSARSRSRRSSARRVPRGRVPDAPRRLRARREAHRGSRAIAAVTLTGSEGAGARVGGPPAPRSRRCVLELGGSDPFVVMPSADLERRRRDGGQGPDDQQRPVLHRRQALHRASRRRRRVRAALRREDGGPQDRRSRSTRRRRDRPARHAGDPRRGRRARAEDRRRRRPRALGGQRPGRPRQLLPADRARGRPAGSPADHEEIFGPVASLFRVASLDEAIAARQRHALRPRRLRLDQRRRRARPPRATSSRPGAVFINGMVKSDPRLPFGGVKKSGLRARALRARHPRVRQRQDGLGGVGRSSRRRASSNSASTGGAGADSGRLTRPTERASARSSNRRTTVPGWRRRGRLAGKDRDPRDRDVRRRAASPCCRSRAPTAAGLREAGARFRPSAGRRSPARSEAGARPSRSRARRRLARRQRGASRHEQSHLLREQRLEARARARRAGPSTGPGRASPSATARLTPPVPLTSSRTRSAGRSQAQPGQQRRERRLAAGSIEPIRSRPLLPSRSSAALRASESTASRIGRRARRQQFAGRSLLPPAAPAVEERETELRLELLDVQGHRRLRQAERLRGAAKAPLAQDGLKGQEVTQVQWLLQFNS